jgi:hypothetical protein
MNPQGERRYENKPTHSSPISAETFLFSFSVVEEFRITYRNRDVVLIWLLNLWQTGCHVGAVLNEEMGQIRST